MAEISLEEFERRVSQALKQAPDLHRGILQKAGELVLDKAAKHTPEVEGRLKRSYERKPYKGKQEWEISINGDTVEAGTNVYYARMVEEGHPVVVGRGRKKKVVGFAPGKHYFQKGYQEAENEMGDLTQEFFRDLGRMMGFDVK